MSWTSSWHRWEDGFERLSSPARDYRSFLSSGGCAFFCFGPDLDDPENGTANHRLSDTLCDFIVFLQPLHTFIRESLALFIKHAVICGWWMCGSFHVTAGTGCQVNPNTGVGILFVDLPFWSVVTFDETHRNRWTWNQMTDRVGFGSIVLPLGKLRNVSIWRERGARERVSS